MDLDVNNLSSGFANNKGTASKLHKPAHMCSLISVFVIPYLESIVVKLAPYKI